MIVPTATCGQTFTIVWDPSQLTTIDQAVNTLATQAGTQGFDYTIDVVYSPTGVPQKYLTLSYPRRGRVAGTTSLVVDTSSPECLGYSWPTDSTQQALRVYGIGAGSGPGSTLRSTQSYPALIVGGYPILEATLQRSDIINEPALVGVTTSFLAARAYPVAAVRAASEQATEQTPLPGPEHDQLAATGSEAVLRHPTERLDRLADRLAVTPSDVRLRDRGHDQRGVPIPQVTGRLGAAASTR